MDNCTDKVTLTTKERGRPRMPQFFKKSTKRSLPDMMFTVGCHISIALLCLSLFSILYFLGKTGFLVFNDISPQTFFFSTEWVPESNQFGAAAMIAGTFALTFLTLIIAVPISLCLAIFNAIIAPPSFRKIYRIVLDLLVGIPSVVYGYLGLTIIIPLMRTMTGTPMGDGILVSALVLSLMVLPTITRLSDDALTSVPKEYIEAAYSLGVTRARAIRTIWIPAAGNGIVIAVVLGMARAIGETMAVAMVIGNVAQLPMGFFTPTAVMTSTIVSQVLNVQFDSTWNHALYMMAFVLLIIAVMMIAAAQWIKGRGEIKR